MPDDNAPAPEPPPPEQPTLLGNLAPDEMFARGMQTAKMTSGTQGTWQPPSIEECARLFPGYEVLRLLGRGGMGAVYQARQIELDRLVAIKLLPLEISVDKDFADRFRREARAMAKLHHPHIITVFDFGTTREGHLYFVMEYVEGANLADLIHQAGLTGEQALAIVEQVCTALAYAHNKGVVHRDIKPANVMIDTESQVKVADFGLARLTDPSAEQWGHTMTGTVMGTPDYMAPEQMKGMNVDHRADIYSLGVMVYEMLCREVPRGAFEPPSVRAGCDPRIDPIVIKAMQPNPERRYQSTQEMKSDVAAVLAPPLVGTSVPAPPLSLPRKPASPKAPPKAPLAPPETAVMQAIKPPGPKAKSHKLLYTIVAAVVLAIIAAAVVVPKRGGTRSSVSPTTGGVVADKAAPSESLEPGAIKPWDSPEKIPSGSKAKWEGHALLLDQQTDLGFGGAPSKDAYLRASIRMNPDAEGAQLNLRYQKPDGARANFYRLTIYVQNPRVELFSVVPGELKRLGTWPLPKTYSSDEWVRLELRAIGDELTALADGQVLGSVRDRAVPTAGDAHLYANAKGYFRDIVYVPLDKPGATAAPAEPLEPGAIKLWDSPETIPAGPGVSWKDGVLHVDADTAGFKTPRVHSPTSRDVVLRASIRLNSDGANQHLSVRCRGALAESYNYSFGFGSNGNLMLFAVIAGHYHTLKEWPLARTRDANKWMTLELRAVGDELTVSADGQALGTLRDTSVSESGYVEIYAKANSYFRDIVYVPLDKPGAAAAPAKALELGAIKLWDSPEKIPKQEGVSWENDSLRLNHLLTNSQQASADAIVRASVRMNPDADTPQIGLRAASKAGVESRYVLRLNPKIPDVALDVVEGSKYRMLKKWPLPRAYGADEWVQIELRAIGDELTASLDGQILGTVRDMTISEAGGVAVYAKANGYFRDIVYVPLDKPGTPAASAETLEPGAIKLWDSPEKIPAGTAASWKDDAVRVDTTESDAPAPVFRSRPSRDFVMRASVRLNAGGAEQQLHVRARGHGTEFYYYSLGLAPGRKSIQLGAMVASRWNTLKSWPLPRTFGDDEWLKLELRAVGNELTVFADGQTLGTVQDTSIPEAGIVGIYAKADGYFRDIVYVPLDKPGAAESEPWQDLLHDPTKGRIGGDAMLRPDGALLTAKGFVEARESKPEWRDGALRVTTTFQVGSLRPSLFARQNPNNDHYRLNVPQQNLVTLWRSKAGEPTLLREFPLDSPLAIDSDYTLELRAVGNELTAKLNGRVLGTVQDDVISSGSFSLNPVRNGLDAAVLIKALHYLPLEKPATTSAQAPPVGSAAPGKSESWHDWLAEQRAAGTLPTELKEESGGFRVASRFAAKMFASKVRDQAIRVTAVLDSDAPPPLQLYLRSWGPSYRVLCKGTIRLEHFLDLERQTPLATADLPEELQRHGREIILEFRAVGDLLTVTVNGTVLTSVHDAALKEGAAAISCPPGWLLKKVEWLDLDKSAASASVATP